MPDPVVSKRDVWHVEDVSSENLDNGMASIITVVKDDGTREHRCRIDDDGYLRPLQRGDEKYVPRGGYHVGGRD